MSQEKRYSYLDYKSSTPVYKQPETQITLKFKNYNNSEYTTVVEDVPEVEQGTTFKEMIARGFQLEEINTVERHVYGLGKKLQPKTQAINDMKTTIDEMTDELNKLDEQERQRLEQLAIENENLKTTLNETDKEVDNGK